MLDEKPEIQRSFITDIDSDPDNVIVTMAIRNQYTFEMEVPKDKHDAFAMIELLDKHKEKPEEETKTNEPDTEYDEAAIRTEMANDFDPLVQNLK